MKKNKLLFVTVLSTACLFSLASCGTQGPKGDQGDPGINGTNGTNGKDGENGEDGNSVRTGKGAPAQSLGKDGDSYIDTESFDFYVKSNGAWSKEGNLKGDSGEEGSTGEDGTSIHTGKGEPEETLGNDGDSYIDLLTFDFYVKEDGEWSKEGNIKGEKGDQGDKGETGDKGWNGSQGSQGNPGDTAWSNTILPSTGGYVTANVGSAIVGDDVIFTLHANEGYKPLNLYLNGEAYTLDDNNQCTVQMQENGFVVQGNFYNTTPEGGSGTPLAIDEKTGKSYTSINAAITANVTEITLADDVDSSEANVVVNGGKKVTINLNGNDLNLDKKPELTRAQSNKSEEKKNFTIALRNGSLDIQGKGTIKTDSEQTMFSVYGYYPNHSEGEYKTTLTIGKDVTLEGNGCAVGIYALAEEPYTNDAQSKPIGYAKGVTVNFNGTDKTKDGFYVNGDVRDASAGDKTPTININGATLYSRSYIAGYAKLNVEESTFHVQGTAFNMTSGDVTFKNNKFYNELGVDVNDYNKEVKLKTPDYVWYEGDIDHNATLWFQNGLVDSLQGFTSVVVEGNTFETTNTLIGEATEDDKTYAKWKLENWKDVSMLLDDVHSTNTVTPKDSSGKEAGSVTKLSELKFRIKVTFGSSKALYAYFKDASSMKAYFEKGGEGDQNILARECGFNTSDFPNVKFDEMQSSTDGSSWSKYEESNS